MSYYTDMLLTGSGAQAVRAGHPKTCLCWHAVAGISLQPIRNLGARRGWIVLSMPRPI
jgi:hypothetical protein